MENKKIKVITSASLAIVAFIFMYVYVAHRLVKKNVVNQTSEVISKTNPLEVNCSKYNSDANAYSSAVKSGDASACYCIKDEALKNKCVGVVSDIISYNQAIADMDGGKCDKISADPVKTFCSNIVRSENSESDDAHLIVKREDIDGSIGKYEKVIKKKSNDLKSILFLALDYATKGTSNKEDVYIGRAFYLVQQAKNINANNVMSYKIEAQVYLMNKEFNEAENAMSESIKKHPNCASCYKIMAAAMFAQGKYDEALNNSLLGIGLIDEDDTLENGEGGELKRDFDYLVSSIYESKGDASNRDKYRDLGDNVSKM